MLKQAIPAFIFSGVIAVSLVGCADDKTYDENGIETVVVSDDEIYQTRPADQPFVPSEDSDEDKYADDAGIDIDAEVASDAVTEDGVGTAGDDGMATSEDESDERQPMGAASSSATTSEQRS